jgi:putative phage-type endonuclease
MIQGSEEWHAARRKVIGASEIAALFGESPYMTKFQLWQIKAGRIEPDDLSENERVQAGIYLEPAVARWISEREGWHIKRGDGHTIHSTVAGMGASLDYEIIFPFQATLEIKTVDWLVRRAWGEEPPLSYLLQCQHQMACTEHQEAVLGVLVGGNNLEIFRYPRRPKVIAAIEQAVAEFWQSIRDNRPPTPDYAADYATIAKLYASTSPGKQADFTGDNRMPELMVEYTRGLALEKEGETVKKAAAAEITAKMGDSEFALLDDYKITMVTRNAVPDRVITEAMVGEVLKGKAASRYPKISKREAK